MGDHEVRALDRGERARHLPRKGEEQVIVGDEGGGGEQLPADGEQGAGGGDRERHPTIVAAAGQFLCDIPAEAMSDG